ncbi:MAG: response regulator [Pseudomonadota bacterium]
MSKPHAIALAGFTAFERTTFESFFRLAARRVQGYALVDDIQACDLIVANADDGDTMAALFARPPTVPVLLVGQDDAGTGWPIEPRPIKLMNVLTAVDQMLGMQPAAAAPPPAPRNGTRAFAPTRPFAGDPALQPSAPAAPAADDGILVVDGSDATLAAMRKLLQRVGFTADVARSADEAFSRLQARPYRLVFLDAGLEGTDGYQACKLIKQGKYGNGGPPIVVMLTGRAGTIDKIKGSMAGCDAWLAKPPEERALLKLLAKYDDQVQRSFQATRLGTDADRPPRGDA